MTKKKKLREIGLAKDGRAVFEAYCGDCAVCLQTGKTFCTCGKKAPE